SMSTSTLPGNPCERLTVHHSVIYASDLSRNALFLDRTGTSVNRLSPDKEMKAKVLHDECPGLQLHSYRAVRSSHSAFACELEYLFHHVEFSDDIFKTAIFVHHYHPIEKGKRKRVGLTG
ncbi:MAG: hypothetical protein MUP55_03660, partial [Candidatus Aenigmarchaeota archaeon]|nr:hypothetical protein [Candidatus Aenigmarchaeota archaeon]